MTTDFRRSSLSPVSAMYRQVLRLVGQGASAMSSPSTAVAPAARPAPRAAPADAHRAAVRAREVRGVDVGIVARVVMCPQQPGVRAAHRDAGGFGHAPRQSRRGEHMRDGSRALERIHQEDHGHQGNPIAPSKARGDLLRMLRALRSRRVEKLPDQVVLRGRILFLAEDAALVQRQLDGEDLAWRPSIKLRDNISTDEITPAYICYYYDETLGDFPYLGLKCGEAFPITRGSVKRGGFVASVSGKRRGKGSSREQSPYAEMCAGIKLGVWGLFPR